MEDPEIKAILSGVKGDSVETLIQMLVVISKMNYVY